MIIGDFNDLLCAADKWGTVHHPTSLMDGFKPTLEYSFLTKLDLCGGRFTWEKSRGTKYWVKERLDKAFATTAWWRKFLLCK